MDIINLDLEKTDQAVNCCQATASVFRLQRHRPQGERSQVLQSWMGDAFGVTTPKLSLI